MEQFEEFQRFDGFYIHISRICVGFVYCEGREVKQEVLNIYSTYSTLSHTSDKHGFAVLQLEMPLGHVHL